jgi:hypothetical protein
LFVSWGLKVIELQINRAELADAHYAAEYEASYVMLSMLQLLMQHSLFILSSLYVHVIDIDSSLTVAKMKANARAQEAKNFVTIAQVYSFAFAFLFPFHSFTYYSLVGLR